VFDLAYLPERLLAVAFILLVGFPIHEAAHAWAAYVQGDSTAKLFGRLTLNPLVHFDRLGGSLLVLSAFAGWIMGWAKPTPYNPANLRNRRNGEVLVALAGPASNLIVGLAAGVIFRLIGGPQMSRSDFTYNLFHYLVFLEIGLGFINLLPIPPFDGSAILLRFVSPRQAWQVRQFTGQYGMMVILAVLILFSVPISLALTGVTHALLGTH
jgi:Zn-dependent protease